MKIVEDLRERRRRRIILDCRMDLPRFVATPDGEGFIVGEIVDLATRRTTYRVELLDDGRRGLYASDQVSKRF